MRNLSLWHEQEYRKTLPEAIAETVAAFYEMQAWEYDVWSIGMSGGKDSTAVVTLLAYLFDLEILPRPKRVLVQYADTGMEIPPLRQSALRILDQLAFCGFETQVVHPALDTRFFVYMLGRGVPPPNTVRMRWCTRVLKVDPMARAMEAAEHAGKQLLITGVREGESAIRNERIAALCSKDGGECGQGYLHIKFQDSAVADTLAPVLMWRVCHIFDWLNLFAPFPEFACDLLKDFAPRPLQALASGGFDTTTIAEIYGHEDGDGQEEPLSARTGCMECPLVTTPQGALQPDAMMERVTAIPRYAYLAPIKRLPTIYQALLSPQNRLQKDGTQRLKDGSIPKNLYRKGPLTLAARRWGLAQVKAIQEEVNVLARAQGMPPISLISLEEEARIVELIEAHTWPQGWNGTEPLAAAFQEPVEEPVFIQLPWTEQKGSDAL